MGFFITNHGRLVFVAWRWRLYLAETLAHAAPNAPCNIDAWILGSRCCRLRMVGGVGKGKQQPRGCGEMTLLVHSSREASAWRCCLCHLPACQTAYGTTLFVLGSTMPGDLLRLVSLSMWVLICCLRTRWWALPLAELVGVDSAQVMAALGHVALISSAPQPWVWSSL